MSPEIKDKYRLVYMTMVLHGVGTLIPWNMFINAKTYFENYKLGQPNALWYSANLFPYFFWSSQLPNVLFAWLNIFWPQGNSSSLKHRISFTLTVELLVCGFTMALIPVDTTDSPAVFFWLTIVSVAVINIAASLFQNSIYGEASKLGYSSAVVLGSNMCGLLVSLTSVLIVATSPSQLTSAVFYFGTATFIMLLCLLSYLKLSSLKFYQFCNGESNHMEQSNIKPQKNRNVTEYFYVLKQCWVQCFNVFMVFLVTFTIFPAVLANVRRLESTFPISSEEYFPEITCFLTFNLFAFLGNLLASWIYWPSEKYLSAPVILRLLFVPFFLLCNYHPVGFSQDQSTVLFGDWFYWMGSALLGLTHGHFTSLAMTYCPKIVQNTEHVQMAGMLGAAFLVLGVFVGVNLAVVMPYFVGTSAHF